MDIQELKDKKTKLEETIRDMINLFIEDNEVNITDVDGAFISIRDFGFAPKNLCSKIKIKIDI